jgi:hypothetical protein
MRVFALLFLPLLFVACKDTTNDDGKPTTCKLIQLQESEIDYFATVSYPSALSTTPNTITTRGGDQYKFYNNSAGRLYLRERYNSISKQNYDEISYNSKGQLLAVKSYIRFDTGFQLLADYRYDYSTYPLVKRKMVNKVDTPYTDFLFDNRGNVLQSNAYEWDGNNYYLKASWIYTYGQVKSNFALNSTLLMYVLELYNNPNLPSSFVQQYRLSPGSDLETNGSITYQYDLAENGDPMKVRAKDDTGTHILNCSYACQ